ncbi:MAG: M23 family metallopeptidase [Oscillospiraceae bacterium]|nr:M23 family metallopeptidase [Oscillospiraceae bacterium]
MSDSKKNRGVFAGRGYYIALILCAAAIGISGYLYYRNLNETQEVLGTTEGNSAAVSTQPGNSATGPAGTEAPIPSQPLKTAAPVAGQTVAEFAVDCLGYNETTRDWRTHHGVDIAAEAGTAVCAAAAGTVYSVYDDEELGTTVVITHDGGYTTKYASLAEDVSVTPGDSVTLGQAIGTVGTTALLENALAPHVHFSVTCNGESMDPMEFISAAQ